MYCKRCGRQISDNSKFCNNCGATIQNSFRQSNTQKQFGRSVSYKNGKKITYRNKPFKIKVVIIIAVIIIANLMGRGVGWLIANSWNSPDSMVKSFFETCENKDVDGMVDLYERSTKYVIRGKQISESKAKADVEDWYNEFCMNSDYTYEIESEEPMESDDLLEYQMELKIECLDEKGTNASTVTEGKKIDVKFRSDNSECKVEKIEFSFIKVDRHWLIAKIHTQ